MDPEPSSPPIGLVRVGRGGKSNVYTPESDLRKKQAEWVRATEEYDRAVRARNRAVLLANQNGMSWAAIGRLLVSPENPDGVGITRAREIAHPRSERKAKK